MSTLTKKYTTITVDQLKQLFKETDGSQDIRIWVEMTDDDGNIYLEGRRLIGTLDDPNDKYFCLVAGFYNAEEDE